MDTAKLADFDNGSYKCFTGKYEVERNLMTLLGIVNGIQSDKVINELERKAIDDWARTFIPNRNIQPYHSILQMLEMALEDGVLTEDEKLDISWLINNFVDDNGYFNKCGSGINELLGIITGISCDNIINEAEIQYLDKWIAKHRILKNCWPYDELESLLTKVLSDKKVMAHEQAELLHFCKSLSSDKNDNGDLVKILNEGYCQMDPEIIIPEQTFCITGISPKFKRRQIAEKIELYGGIVRSGVSGVTNYLVVCAEKNDAWMWSAYGRKVETVIDLRRAGKKIAIVHENDLHDAFENYN